MSVADRIAALDPDAKRVVLEALDELTRPLNARELEHALSAAEGLSRRDRMTLVSALRGVAIVAVISK